MMQTENSKKTFTMGCAKPVVTYNVEFLLQFIGEDREGKDPYHGSQCLDVEKLNMLENSEELKAELTEMIRKRIAGLNEFPIEIVLVELVKFERKESA